VRGNRYSSIETDFNVISHEEFEIGRKYFEEQCKKGWPTLVRQPPGVSPPGVLSTGPVTTTMLSSQPPEFLMPLQESIPWQVEPLKIPLHEPLQAPLQGSLQAPQQRLFHAFTYGDDTCVYYPQDYEATEKKQMEMTRMNATNKNEDNGNETSEKGKRRKKQGLKQYSKIYIYQHVHYKKRMKKARCSIRKSKTKDGKFLEGLTKDDDVYISTNSSAEQV
jgi:hypothetical protein